MALKILLAEDEEALSRVYKAALEHQGYEVDQAFNGQEAVDLAAQNAYQVMIMDIMMPIKTGIEALKEIRSSGDRTHVIMLVAGNAIRLSSRETKLMAHFMINPAKKLTTDHLFKTIWDDEEDVDESIVWVYISYLRQKLQAIQADISILGEKGGDFCLLQD